MSYTRNSAKILNDARLNFGLMVEVEILPIHDLGWCMVLASPHYKQKVKSEGTEWHQYSPDSDALYDVPGMEEKQ